VGAQTTPEVWLTFGLLHRNIQWFGLRLAYDPVTQRDKRERFKVFAIISL
jgi:hypothetical protein